MSPDLFTTACDAHDQLNAIRRDFLRACRAVQENATSMDPVVFREWLDRERAAGTRFELAVRALSALGD